MSHPSRAWPAIISHAASAIFVGLQAVFFIVRKLPIAKLPGIAPRVLAIAGSNYGMLYYLLPPAEDGNMMLSALIISTGMFASVYVLIHLGRALSVLPQARTFVSSGPYRWVRHPLYLTEQVSSLGVMLQFAQPWAAIVFLAGLIMQCGRIVFEERIMSEAFPAYRTYAAATARLIPGVY
jgi:protein-S-isoprenylcysteine O-methyltransferase Ste14